MPRCPYTSAIQFDDRCSNTECWMHAHRAQHACAALDTGSTHLVVNDVARVMGLPLSEVEDRVARGRRKAEDWRKMLVELADVDERSACPRCGASPCVGDACASEAKEIARLKDLLPLDAVERMNAARWRRVLEITRAGSSVTSLKV